MNRRWTEALLLTVALAAVAGCPQTGGGPGDGGASSGASGTAGSSGSTTRGGSSSSGGGGTTTGGTPAPGTLGAACALDAFGNDPCIYAGLECLSAGDGGLTCQPPVEFGWCTSAVGCAKIPGFPLNCEQGYPGLDGGDWSLCIERCSQTADCQDTGTSCQNLGQGKVVADRCWLNVCSPDGGAGLYAPCNAATDAGDGQCLPAAAGKGEVGICYQNGPATAGQLCGQGRDAGQPACGYSLVCANWSSPSKSACLPITVDGGCGSSTALFDIGSRYFGVCAEPCSTVGSTCQGNLTCQTTGVSAFCLP